MPRLSQRPGPIRAWVALHAWESDGMRSSLGGPFWAALRTHSAPGSCGGTISWSLGLLVLRPPSFGANMHNAAAAHDGHASYSPALPYPTMLICTAARANFAEGELSRALVPCVGALLHTFLQRDFPRGFGFCTARATAHPALFAVMRQELKRQEGRGIAIPCAISACFCTRVQSCYEEKDVAS